LAISLTSAYSKQTVTQIDSLSLGAGSLVTWFNCMEGYWCVETNANEFNGAV